MIRARRQLGEDWVAGGLASDHLCVPASALALSPTWLKVGLPRILAFGKPGTVGSKPHNWQVERPWRRAMSASSKLVS